MVGPYSDMDSISVGALGSFSVELMLSLEVLCRGPPWDLVASKNKTLGDLESIQTFTALTGVGEGKS